jgi:CRP-like cAMP-binding protein
MSISTLEPSLASQPFFAGLAEPHLALLTGCASNVVFDAGELVFREGQPADRFYLLRHGRVGLEIFPPAGGPLTIETLEEGEVLGFSWLFPPYKSRFDARALTLVRALSLDGACLRRKCEEDKTLGYELVKRFAALIIERLESTRLQLLDVYGQPR